MLSTIAHHRPATSAVTCGVKYRPSAAPIVHCAALRNGADAAGGRVRRIDASAVASSGPIIQGSGVPRTTHS